VTESQARSPSPGDLREAPNFDRVARLYRPLEYLTLGRTLERCRLHLLPHLASRTRALVLGDGDGRFLAHLLQQNPLLHADAIDTSAAMLQVLQTRCHTAQTRLRPHQTDALAFAATSPAIPYDLVVTHFFLDCLTQQELETLASRVAPNLAPDALWLVSDFRIPTGPWARPARTLVRSLYLAFHILTGLRVTALPDHEAALTRAGLSRVALHRSMAGILTTELWSNADSSPPLACNPPVVCSLLDRMGETFPIPSSSAADRAKHESAAKPFAENSPADPIPNPEPATPSLQQPDPGVYPSHS
jgi:SAM-dependent methyltransferase